MALEEVKQARKTIFEATEVGVRTMHRGERWTPVH